VKTEKQWEIVHAYRRSVRRNIAIPTLCFECNQELVPVVGKDSEPVLRCLRCNTLTHLGLNDLEWMEGQT